MGEKIAVLVDEIQQPGIYKIEFKVETDSKFVLPSGAYFYQIKSGSYSEVKKMLLIK